MSKKKQWKRRDGKRQIQHSLKPNASGSLVIDMVRDGDRIEIGNETSVKVHGGGAMRLYITALLSDEIRHYRGDVRVDAKRKRA